MLRVTDFMLIACMLCSSLAGKAEQYSPDWQAIIANESLPPTGNERVALLQALTQMSRSLDPVARDNTSYEILRRWIHQQGALSAPEKRELFDNLATQAALDLGKTGDHVFARSFALLLVKELVANDVNERYLSQLQLNLAVQRAANALCHEQDQRGYVINKGWAHALAHAADLVRVLAQHPGIDVNSLTKLLQALQTYGQRSHMVWQWGEDDRAGRALARLIMNPKMPKNALQHWLSQLSGQYQSLWHESMTDAKFASVQNQLNLIRKAQLVLAAEAFELPGSVAPMWAQNLRY